MLIVEGADFAGKSTMLVKLQAMIVNRDWPNKYGAGIAKLQRWGRPSEDFDYFASYMRAVNDGQLCDRFVLSELAYGTAFRGGPNARFTTHNRRRVARELNRLGSMQLVLRADWDSTNRRMASRGHDEMMPDKRAYNALRRGYSKALEDLAIGRAGLNTLELDNSDGTDTVTMQLRCVHVLDEWQVYLDRAAQISRIDPDGWGYLFPAVVFVGDRVSYLQGSGHRPFMAPGYSSETLTRLLDEAGIGERMLYYLNSYDSENRPLGREIFDVLQPRLVVTLGHAASKLLIKLKVHHAEFPHPQWIRRFENKRIPLWADELRSLVKPFLATPATSSR